MGAKTIANSSAIHIDEVLTEAQVMRVLFVVTVARSLKHYLVFHVSKVHLGHGMSILRLPRIILDLLEILRSVFFLLLSAKQHFVPRLLLVQEDS